MTKLQFSMSVQLGFCPFSCGADRSGFTGWLAEHYDPIKVGEAGFHFVGTPIFLEDLLTDENLDEN